MQRPAAKALAHNPFLALLREVKSDIDRRVEERLDAELRARAELGKEVAAMLEEARALSLRGGKRLRAALVLAGQKATERRATRWDRALEVGTAVELLQSYFLIHDDWMDQDATRRGGPSAHVALSRRLRSTHKGAASAILAGDYLVALATRTALEATRGHRCQSELAIAFAEMQLSAVIGQELDVVGLTRDADRVYEFKTASYTVSGPLKLGALLSSASTTTLTAIEHFATPIGVAFQLRDDLLSLFASPEVTGKPFANDLRSGKWTWIVQWTLKHGKAAERRALKAVFGEQDAKLPAVRSALRAIRQAGGEEATEQRIRELQVAGLEALNRARLPARGTALLEGAARAFIERGV